MANNNDIHRNCKKRVAYAWAQYYSALNEQFVNYVPVRNVYRNINKNEPLPAHITKEFMEMAEELRKKYTCPICIDDVEIGNVEITGCGHFYCIPCLQQLKGSSRDAVCAVCRRELK